MAASEVLHNPDLTPEQFGQNSDLFLVASHLEDEPKTGLYADYVLPTYHNEVNPNEVITGKGVPQDQYGTTYIDRLQMNDEAKTRYKVLRGLADNPISNVWVVKDTAWSTEVTGLNEDVARQLMALGLNVLIKGPEINSSIPLSESAFNTHAVLDYYHKRGDLNAREIAIEGYSRGSMIGFGTIAYARQFGRKVLYSNLTDPCVALPIKVLDKEATKKLVTLPVDIGLLAIAAAQGVFDVRHPKRGLHLLKTIDVSKHGAGQFYRTGKPLMTGEAGMMAARTPHDMQATIAFFRRCRVNDAKVYQKILENRPGVRFVSPEGGHGGGIDSRIIGNIAVRFGRLAKQLDQGRTSEELDYRNITFGTKLAA